MLQELKIEFIVYIPILLLLFGLIFVCLIDSYVSRKSRRIMLLVIALVFSLAVRVYLGFMLDIDGSYTFTRTLVAIFGYSIRPIILLLFFYIVDTKQKYWPFWLLVSANVLIHLTALFSGICFSIDAANQFHRGPLGYSCHIISGFLLFYLLYLTNQNYNRIKKAEAWIPIINVVLIIASVLLDSAVDYHNYLISFLTIAAACSTLFYYIWLHLQFVRRHEDALQAEQRIQIIMTQIQPHFLFNTIATVKSLCRIDPEKAAEIAEKFGAYLRQNLDSLNVVGLIPLRKELEHTKLYADIEMVRFGNIRVEYDIADDDFTIPPLSIQPMVENAIRHGVRIREEGLVKVITRRQPEYHEIIITDNGVGFDENALAIADDRQHIGIQNVKERIETMCGGTLRIDSKTGSGTTVTICLPIKEEAVT